MELHKVQRIMRGFQPFADSVESDPMHISDGSVCEDHVLSPHRPSILSTCQHLKNSRRIRVCTTQNLTSVPEREYQIGPRLKRFHEYTNFPESSNFLGNSKCKISCTLHLRAEPPSTGRPQHVQNSGRVYVCTYQAFRNRYEYKICLGSSNTQSNRGRTNQTKRKNKSYNSLYENEHE